MGTLYLDTKTFVPSKQLKIILNIDRQINFFVDEQERRRLNEMLQRGFEVVRGEKVPVKSVVTHLQICYRVCEKCGCLSKS